MNKRKNNSVPFQKRKVVCIDEKIKCYLYPLIPNSPIFFYNNKIIYGFGNILIIFCKKKNKFLKKIEKHDNTIRSIDVSPNGQYFLTSGDDKHIIVYDDQWNVLYKIIHKKKILKAYFWKCQKIESTKLDIFFIDKYGDAYIFDLNSLNNKIQSVPNLEKVSNLDKEKDVVNGYNRKIEQNEDKEVKLSYLYDALNYFKEKENEKPITVKDIEETYIGIDESDYSISIKEDIIFSSYHSEQIIKNTNNEYFSNNTNINKNTIYKNMENNNNNNNNNNIDNINNKSNNCDCNCSNNNNNDKNNDKNNNKNNSSSNDSNNDNNSQIEIKKQNKNVYETLKKLDEHYKQCFENKNLLYPIFTCNSSTATCLYYDNKYLIIGDKDEKIRIIKNKKLYKIYNFYLNHKQFITSVTLINENMFCSAAADSYIYLWHIKTKEISDSLFLDFSFVSNLIQNNSCINDLKQKQQKFIISILLFNEKTNSIFAIIENVKGIFIFPLKQEKNSNFQKFSKEKILFYPLEKNILSFFITSFKNKQYLFFIDREKGFLHQMELKEKEVVTKQQEEQYSGAILIHPVETFAHSFFKEPISINIGLMDYWKHTTFEENIL